MDPAPKMVTINGLVATCTQCGRVLDFAAGVLVLTPTTPAEGSNQSLCHECLGPALKALQGQYST